MVSVFPESFLLLPPALNSHKARPEHDIFAVILKAGTTLFNYYANLSPIVDILCLQQRFARVFNSFLRFTVNLTASHFRTDKKIKHVAEQLQLQVKDFIMIAYFLEDIHIIAQKLVSRLVRPLSKHRR